MTTLNEAIKRFESNAEFEKRNGNLQGCLEFGQLTEWLKDYKRLLEQEPTDKSNLEKICEELAAENDDLRDQLAMRDRFQKQESIECDECKYKIFTELYFHTDPEYSIGDCKNFKPQEGVNK